MKILEQLKKEADMILRQMNITKNISKQNNQVSNQPKANVELKALSRKISSITTASVNSLHSPQKSRTEEQLSDDTNIQQIQKREATYKIIPANEQRDVLKYQYYCSVNGVIVSERNELVKVIQYMALRNSENTKIVLPLPPLP